MLRPMGLSPATPAFCRELALAEPLAGTAKDGVQRWILLEDNGPWGPKVPHETALPAAIREWLFARDAEPNTRVQLIRRPGARAGLGVKLFIASAVADASARRLVELDLPINDIPSLDPDALLARAPARDPGDLAALYLVCTHGTRDRCCAKWGMPVFDALRRLDPERVWQCSHLGGHKFAPTFLALPSGLVWGRVELDELAPLHTNLRAGRLGCLSKLRGRCCHSPFVQAAECLLRERELLLEDDALKFVEDQILADQAHQVCFERGGERVQVVIEAAALGVSTASDCGEPIKPRMYFRMRPWSE
jgi:hypothetical protein